MFDHFTLRLLGMVGCVWCCFHLISFCLSHCANLCSVFWFLMVARSFGVWVWYFLVFYSACECECLSMFEALDCLSYITVFLCSHNMCVLVS